ncbi:SIS domain-containing protein [Desulfovibrio sp. OttesenSCG-928-A18]|nr:SIS domain-containing protein [Desulfovibrio sp. OttesenSCG-928-A18]
MESTHPLQQSALIVEAEMNGTRQPGVSAWDAYRLQLREALASLSFCDGQGASLSVQKGFERLLDHSQAVVRNRASLYCAGNGASAAMCSHFAADVSKNTGLRARVFTDPALLTAYGNDESFEQIFAGPLRNSALPGDCLLVVSSSGNSPNVVAALRTARELGLSAITLTGMSPANTSRSLGNLNMHIAAGTYGLIEPVHAAVLHYWTDALIAAVTQPTNDQS